MGESVTEGSIVKWRVKPGQWIDAGETLVDVTTDKVDVEVPAPAAGLVKSILAEEGATVKVGAALAEIDTAAAKPAGEAAHAPEPTKAPETTKPPESTTKAQPNGQRGGVASQRARRLAERARLDLGRVAGSGPDGLILLSDVLHAEDGARTPAPNGAAAPTSPALPPLSPESKLTPLKGPAASLVGYMGQRPPIPPAESFSAL